MKLFSVFSAVLLTCAAFGLRGQDLDQIRKMEASGDVAGARAALAREVDSSPGNIAALTNYAEFLHRYGDPGCREVYTRLLSALRQSGDTARSEAITKRLALLDLLSGTGTQAAPLSPENPATIRIPG